MSYFKHSQNSSLHALSNLGLKEDEMKNEGADYLAFWNLNGDRPILSVGGHFTYSYGMGYLVQSFISKANCTQVLHQKIFQLMSDMLQYKCVSVF